MSETTEEPRVVVNDKRGKTYRPPGETPPAPAETGAEVDQEELLLQHAARAAEDEQANADAIPQYPEGTIFAQTAFLIYLRPDGVWAVDATMEGNVATQRDPHRTDFVAGCGVILAQVQSDSTSDLAASKVLAAMKSMGEQMAAGRAAEQVQGGAPNQGGMNRAARRRV